MSASVDASPAALPASVPTRRPTTGVRGRATLGVAWLHDHLEVAVLAPGGGAAWQSPTPVHTLADFGAAMDAAMEQLGVRGGDVQIILEQEQFQHRLEQGPAASEAVSRTYLSSLVARLEHGAEPFLWVSEAAGRARREASWCLHLLPTSFYRQLTQILRARRLEVARLVPLTLPLQLELNHLPDAQDAPVLLAATTGRGTVIVAGQAHQPLLFARVILASWEQDPARVGTEINRSLFYAKQQFGAIIQRIALRGPVPEATRAAIQSRCNGETSITAAPAAPIGWLQSVHKLSLRHPVNLIVGYLRRRRRERLVRHSLIAACWLLFAMTGLNLVRDLQHEDLERQHLAELAADVGALRAERDRLLARNAVAAEQTTLIAAIEADRLPTVPTRFLAHLAGHLPPEVQLTAYDVRCDPTGARWGFHLEGLAEGSPEQLRDRVAQWQEELAAGPFHPRFMTHQPVTAPAPRMNSDDPVRTRLILEGELFAP